MTSSKGVLIFAYNSTFDYVSMAAACAAMCKLWHWRRPRNDTGIQVTLVTDLFGALHADANVFDNIIVHETDATNKRSFRLNLNQEITTIDWKNLTRADAYELSPYDETLLLDADYLMFTADLFSHFGTDAEFTCYKDVLDVTGQNSFKRDRRLGQYSIPMLWATAIYFKKCEFSKAVFDMMKTIKSNYSYYSMVYGFNSTPYRNDFALSIAHHALSGYGTQKLMPNKLPTLPSAANVVELSAGNLPRILYQYKTDAVYTGALQYTDLHIMNKHSFTPKFIKDVKSYATY